MALCNEVNRYFMDRTKKIYIERCSNKGIETFEQYLGYRYRDSSCEYSVYALMALNYDDFFVRGDTCFCCEQNWVEFKFKGEMYVFDPKTKGVVLKTIWYQENNPQIKHKCTQQDILDYVLTEEMAIEVKDGFWQIKDIKPGNEYILNVLRLSRIQLKTSKENDESKVIYEILEVDPKEKVVRFIAYDEPNE